MPGFDSLTPPIVFAKHTPDSVEENTPNNLENDTVNVAMQNCVSIHEQPTRPNPALAAVHRQAAPSPSTFWCKTRPSVCDLKYRGKSHLK